MSTHATNSETAPTTPQRRSTLCRDVRLAGRLRDVGGQHAQGEHPDVLRLRPYQPRPLGPEPHRVAHQHRRDHRRRRAIAAETPYEEGEQRTEMCHSTAIDQNT